MSVTGEPIRCRDCKEVFDLEDGDCPHCGTSERSNLHIGGAIAVGGIIALLSLFELSSLWFFGVFGAATFLAGVMLLYDKRRRKRMAEGHEVTADEETTRDPF